MAMVELIFQRDENKNQLQLMKIRFVYILFDCDSTRFVFFFFSIRSFAGQL